MTKWLDQHLARKKKRKQEKTELEAAKQAAQDVIYSASKTDEDSPRKVEIHYARQARVVGRGRWLYDELNQKSNKSAEAKQLGDEIFTAYIASAAQAPDHDFLVGDTETCKSRIS